MADTVSSSNYVQLVAAFADGDTRNINVSYPKATITNEEITELEQAAANVLIGDKFGAPFYNFGEVNRIIETVTNVEIL